MAANEPFPDWLACEQVYVGYQQLGTELRQAVRSDDSLLEEIALHLISLGGKRLRPVVLLLARGRAPVDATAIKAAAAVELIHLASLYHDDVMDRAESRRGAESVNGRWGNAAAALAGTYLFARSGQLFADLGDWTVQLAGEFASRMCSGQLREVENAYNLDLSVDEHIDILRLKTATLFELPCRIGAILGGFPSAQVEATAAYGAHLGLAFQLYDDFLDICGDPEVMGKGTEADLKDGVYSLPILTLLQRRDDQSKSLALRLQQKKLSDPDIAQCFDIVRESGVPLEILKVARNEIRFAREAIAVIEDEPIRRSFDALAEFAVSRDM